MVSVVHSTIALQSVGHPLQATPELLATPLGKLLVALVVVALVLVVGRFVMNMAWRLLKIAIVLVGIAWLVAVVLPEIGV